MNQLLLAGCGLFALIGAMLISNPHIKRAAPWVGLCGQPFWLYETFIVSQWGMFALSVAYTAVYVAAIVKTYHE